MIFFMTYIEFFDTITATNNINAFLYDVPERVIFICANTNAAKKMLEKHIAQCAEIFGKSEKNIEFVYRFVSKNNLQNAVDNLSKIVEEYEDCVFDITGGEEIFLLALGIVFEKYADKHIRIHKYNISDNAVRDCGQDSVTIFKDVPKLTLDQNVKIYGGEIIYGTVLEKKTYKWDFSADFLRDIRLIWNICRTNVRLWNAQIGVLAAAEEVGVTTGFTTVTPMPALEHYLQRHGAKYTHAKGVIRYLLKYGLLSDFSENQTELRIAYKNEQVKRCLTRAGQALELKVFVAAKDLVCKDETKSYDDALNGVFIDWDGELHDESAEDIYDVENEIDIMLMHDLIPIFISCKNGIVEVEELYKLHTVAERFGGKYAKKVLVATSIDAMGSSGKYLRQRAKEMDIKLVENIQDLDDEEIAKRLNHLWLKS